MNDDTHSEPRPPSVPERATTSRLLATFRAVGGEYRVTLDEIATATQGRAHGILLVLLALPEIIPMIGFSIILATPIFIIASCMMLYGGESPLPKWFLRTRMRRDIVNRAIDATLPRLVRLERILRPRWPALAQADRLLGAMIAVMAVLLALPIPGINVLAAFSVVLTGIGILERDGVIIAIATTFATLALGALALLLTGGAYVFAEIIPRWPGFID